MSTQRVPVTLVAIMTVRAAALDDFRAFERHAAAAMRAHGGRIERAVVVPVVPVPDVEDVIKEVHVVTFPDAAAFTAYRADPVLAAVAHLRTASVIHTELLTGHDGPDYMAPC